MLTNMSQPQETLNFDAALAALQQTVKKLESGEMNLEDSLKSFEEGIRLTRSCQQHLTAAEQKIEILIKGGDADQKPELQPFNPAKP